MIPTGEHVTEVLLIDDDPAIQQTIGLALEMAGYRVHRFTTARAAIDHFAQRPAALALIDYSMPEISGPEIGRRLRQLPGGERAKLVILTGDHSMEMRRRTLAAGLDGVFCKPMPIPQLLERVGQLHSSSQEEDA